VKAFYNEIDPFCCAWISNLMDAGLITPGKIDDRSIEDVTPSDLEGYGRIHAFAGLAGWERALELAGWPTDRPVWTGSYPCQPFSKAGKGAGFDDKRHLWPAWQWLIQQSRPDTIFGEQVDGKDGYMWLDLVSLDLEAMGYAYGPVVFPSAGVGAPNIRHRIFWVGHPTRGGRGDNGDECGTPENAGTGQLATTGDDPGRLGNAGNAGNARLPHTEPRDLRGQIGHNQRRAVEQPDGPRHPWRQLEWIACTDGKARPTERTIQRFSPGLPERLGLVRSGYQPNPQEEALMLFPLIHRKPGDVGRLRAYGNAINAVAAAEVISAYLDT
jgi:DNA (cytosine-5)-methyltransferase 1